MTACSLVSLTYKQTSEKRKKAYSAVPSLVQGGCVDLCLDYHMIVAHNVPHTIRGAQNADTYVSTTVTQTYSLMPVHGMILTAA